MDDIPRIKTGSFIPSDASVREFATCGLNSGPFGTPLTAEFNAECLKAHMLGGQAKTITQRGNDTR